MKHFHRYEVTATDWTGKEEGYLFSEAEKEDALETYTALATYGSTTGLEKVTLKDLDSGETLATWEDDED